MKKSMLNHFEKFPFRSKSVDPQNKLCYTAVEAILSSESNVQQNAWIK